jgi:hypothetical protein
MHNLLSISVLAVFPGYSGFHRIIGENDTAFDVGSYGPAQQRMHFAGKQTGQCHAAADCNQILKEAESTVSCIINRYV